MMMGIIQFYGPYQGVLGSYLDKSIQTVIDIQSQTGAQSSEAWTAFMHQQAPVMQDLMRQYIDQSKALYLNTQNPGHRPPLLLDRRTPLLASTGRPLQCP